ncbi:MTH865 family protein [Haloferax chudinovii]|uniref:MTH865 family protein n=1 Tax=Haloferax chudinovii TaxID=1109010 RepID=A0ABD5XCE0_9EURY
MSDTESQLREQFMDAFENADFPVKNQMSLVPALPNGPGTKFKTDDVTVTAMELAAKLGKHQDFPYEDAESLVDDIIAGLKEEGVI